MAVPIDARVDREGDTWVVRATLQVAVPPAIAWAVLTDYEAMPRFLPDLTESRRIGTTPDGAVRLLQKGVMRFGPFAQAWEAERAVVLTPETLVTSHLLRGNMKRLDMSTRLGVRDGATAIDYRADLQPDFWLPPLIGPAMMKRQIVAQFQALAAEMQRRAAAAPVAREPSRP
ncbi:MAG: SRPBCC family protein [Burkholderiales bacterium]|nr:SRPBCC family protein [Burkholderiales bacterium]